MKQIQSYMRIHSVQLLLTVLLVAAFYAGLIDGTSALAGGMILDVAPTDLKELNAAMKSAFEKMQENINKVQDTAMKALEETRTEGTLHSKTNQQLTDLGTKGNELATAVQELKTRILDVEQANAKRPNGDGGGSAKSIGQIVAESEEFKFASKNSRARNMDPVTVGSFHKTNILNVNPLTNDQPLVQADRRPGLIMPGLRRMTVRGLLPQNTTSSNLVEFASELLFTNNAAPQGAVTSPDETTEGEVKPESALTFQLENTPVITLAHFIPASRQVLADAPMLQGYVDGRLRYGLMLTEEANLLNGDGMQGTLYGLVSKATAFTGGATNQTALDTLLKAFLQISLQNLEASGVVLNPTDWTNILLLKDTTGRYLFSDPHGVEQPRVWGKDVVATASQTQGQFLAGAFSLAAEIFDREDATVRVAEQHSDFFTRNLVAVLAEERLALAVYRTAAIVKGAISYAIELS